MEICFDEESVFHVCMLQVHLTKEIQTASRQLCHRQMNWFRKESNFRWIQADQNMESILEEITTYWNRDQHEGMCGYHHCCVKAYAVCHSSTNWSLNQNDSILILAAPLI